MSEDKQRISELEREVAALRAQLHDPAASEQHESQEEAFPVGLRGMSPAKMVTVGTAVLAVLIALILGLYLALAKGFDRISEQAAEHLAPIVRPNSGGASPPGSGTAKPESAPHPPTKAEPRAAPDDGPRPPGF